ncbi:hypothetical protein RchiOBHm_Chr3g0488801 [Rosa chinensis]|uniref:Uncharacterized protein n=1 Tax=Rosa chinensis TaxID=74649 RepID=A0A2P6RFV7_ROSCH|nr:hypothetical protein RchiOBHm_Chr3g0488801 [Rosa chinensis]
MNWRWGGFSVREKKEGWKWIGKRESLMGFWWSGGAALLSAKGRMGSIFITGEWLVLEEGKRR